MSNEIKSKIWQATADPTLKFAQIEYEAFEFEPHFHEHFVVMLVERGVNLGRRQREKYALDAGEMLIIQPGEIHTGCSLDGQPLRYSAFYPDLAALAGCLEKLEISPEKLAGFRLHYRNQQLSESFQNVVQASADKPNERLALPIALLDFFEKLLVEQPDFASPRPTVATDFSKFKKAEAFIRENFSENFSLDELAAAVATSPFHLVRLFRRHSGLTPFHFLRNVRVEQAKVLMRRPISLTEVAYRSGFYDQSHFIRSFKRQTGFLPSDFR